MSDLVRYEKVKVLDSDLQKNVVSGHLSRETSFALHITGKYGARELENLMRLLTVQLEMMREYEAEAAALDLQKPPAET